MYSFLWFVPAILTLYLLFPLYYKVYEKAADKTLFTGAMFVLWLAFAGHSFLFISVCSADGVR